MKLKDMSSLCYVNIPSSKFNFIDAGLEELMLFCGNIENVCCMLYNDAYKNCRVFNFVMHRVFAFKKYDGAWIVPQRATTELSVSFNSKSGSISIDEMSGKDFFYIESLSEEKRIYEHKKLINLFTEFVKKVLEIEIDDSWVSGSTYHDIYF